jgi:iron complex transport system ATP-binding protein
LRRLNEQQGITIVAVTHDVNNAVLTSDSVLALKRGKVAFDGTPDDLIAKGVLEEVYETGFELVPRGDAGAPIVVPSGDVE